ncbi:unnamed protein product [Brugia timori]|uniref:Uncharacterized protein n=1 Tax=Brugia timori TaxID=42155 RepID=A0A3P7TIV9_9BILA|nr:unnamed protein product [Brugia timori]
MFGEIALILSAFFNVTISGSMSEVRSVKTGTTDAGNDTRIEPKARTVVLQNRSVPLNHACIYSLIAIAIGIRFSLIVAEALKFNADILKGIPVAIECSKDKADSLPENV